MKTIQTHLKHFLMLIAGVLSSIYMLSCGDKPTPKIVCDSTNTGFIPHELLDRFYFKNGTWWVYKDTSSSAIDSVWVYQSYTDIYIEPDLRKNCEHRAQYNFRSIGGDMWSLSILTRNLAGNETLKDLKFDLYYSNATKNITIYRFDYENFKYQSPTEEGGLISFKDSVIIKNKTFKDILKLDYKQKPLSYEIIKQAWYAKHYGLIKYETWDNKIWELINYKINQ